MTASCADLDPFFDGELPAEVATDFREHLASCERCQAALRGRMQEEAVAAAVEGRAAAPRPVQLEARRRKVLLFAPLLAAAAALAIWFGTRPAEPGLALALAIEHQGATTRGTVAHVGDLVRGRVQGQHHRALWVYLEARELVVACPGATGCGNADGELTLELQVSAPGRYSLVAISAEQPIAAPHGPLDLMLSAVTATGARIEIKHIDVN